MHQQYVCYTIILDMFRALTCPSSGGKIVFTQHLVSSLSVNVYTVHRLRAVCSQPVYCIDVGVYFSVATNDAVTECCPRKLTKRVRCTPTTTAIWCLTYRQVHLTTCRSIILKARVFVKDRLAESKRRGFLFLFDG